MLLLRNALIIWALLDDICSTPLGFSHVWKLQLFSRKGKLEQPEHEGQEAVDRHVGPEWSSWSQQRAHCLWNNHAIHYYNYMWNLQCWKPHTDKQTISSLGDPDTHLSQPNQKQGICISKKQLNTWESVWHCILKQHTPSTVLSYTSPTSCEWDWTNFLRQSIVTPPPQLHKATWADEVTGLEGGREEAHLS